MVKLRQPNRPKGNRGLSMKYLSLLIAATMLLVLWAYQRIFFDSSSNWLLALGIFIAALAFFLAFYNIYKARRGKDR